MLYLIFITSVIITCPAIMLHIKRNLKVKGRINWLITSKVTKKYHKNVGAPIGNKWERLKSKFLTKFVKNTVPQIINLKIKLPDRYEVIDQK